MARSNSNGYVAPPQTPEQTNQFSSSSPSPSPLEPPLSSSSLLHRSSATATTATTTATTKKSGHEGPRAGSVLGGLDAMLDVTDVSRETRNAWREIGRGTKEVTREVASSVTESVRSTTSNARFSARSMGFLIALTAIRPDEGFLNGLEVSLLSEAQASSSISAFKVVLSAL